MNTPSKYTHYIITIISNIKKWVLLPSPNLDLFSPTVKHNMRNNEYWSFHTNVTAALIVTAIFPFSSAASIIAFVFHLVTVTTVTWLPNYWMGQIIIAGVHQRPNATNTISSLATLGSRMWISFVESYVSTHSTTVTRTFLNIIIFYLWSTIMIIIVINNLILENYISTKIGIQFMSYCICLSFPSMCHWNANCSKTNRQIRGKFPVLFI